MDDDNLQWMVESRNKIQSLMLRLLKARANPSTGEWQFMVGAAFSLWRAVFLAHPNDGWQTRGEDIEENAATFLRKVIETNSVSFGDDLSNRVWSGGYYINNARFRLGIRSTEAKGPRMRTDPLRKLWDEAFAELDRRISEAS
jgi:hypothetical protein